MMPEDFYLSTNNASLAVKYRQKLPRLQGLRKWGIKGFEKYLIFYLVTEELEQTLTFWFWGHIM